MQDPVRKQRRRLPKTVVAFLVCTLSLCCPHVGVTQDRSRIVLETQASQKVSLTMGKSLLINSLKPVKRVSLAAPEIADPVVISPRQVYLTGKAVGITNLTLWGEDERVFSIVDVEVVPDLSRLQEKLWEILPGENIRVTATHEGITLFGEVSSPTNVPIALAVAGAFAPKVLNLLQVAGIYQEPVGLSPFLLARLKEKLREILPGENIRVTPTHEGVTLFGDVSSTAILSQALAVAEAFAPQKVTNLLQVAGVHQVMLEVRVAEISRSLTRRLLIRGLGMNYATFVGDASLRLGVFNNLAALSELFPASAFFRFERYGLSLTSFVDALKENGLVKILAEPTLVTLSGQEASFLAGGEFPIPILQRDGITIEFKPFGVSLRFTPTVLGDKKISMRVAPEVSELDFSNAVVIAGFVVPTLTVRRASTVIELANGQSFAIAGLLNENVREVIAKFPVLGDIPILGALFRSSSFRKNETELIIIVTPHLVKPLDLSKQPLPTDQFVEPNDVEFYLLGKLEGQRAGETHIGRLDGEFGYIYGPAGDEP